MKLSFYHLTDLIVRRSAIGLVSTMLFLTACGTPQNTVEEPTATEEDTSIAETQVEESIEQQEQLNVQAGEITGNVEEYVGQTVSVRGEAERAVGESSFLLQDDQLFGGDEIIVVNATGAAFVIPDDEPTEQVQVTGEVRQLVVADFEQEYGLDLEPELHAEYENRPAIVARSIAFAPDPAEVSEEPEQYYGRTIAVSGEIGEQIAPNTFTIQDEGLFGGEEVLVIGATPDPALDENEEVVVTGVLRPYVTAEFERDYNLGWDLDVQQQIEAEYTERPVLVADGVYPSAQ
ncbi:MAG: hypothetical protein HC881_08900 [Leptolyngbyaceae cyanobacterium SL_7_1]|nr:hypothetical protein [Leptolyngbyaceae cyanobacterium SL_7_1]